MAISYLFKNGNFEGYKYTVKAKIEQIVANSETNLREKVVEIKN